MNYHFCCNHTEEASSVTCVASSFWADAIWSTTFSATMEVVDRWRFQPVLCVDYYVLDGIFSFGYLVSCFYGIFSMENVIQWRQNNHQSDF